MNRAVWIDGGKVTLSPASLLGQGGEAEVYDLGDGRVVKWWKPSDHPDFDGLPAAQAAATKRIAEAPARLRALPGRMPAAVVAPVGLALASKRSTTVVGYLMPKIAGTALHAYGEPRWRRDHPVAGDEVLAALLALHDALLGLHRAGVVVGDCNDLNVLVDGRRVHLIDVDSYQLPGFPCAMFSERFVDPRLCDRAGVPIRPHDEASDWFAFAVMAFRSLLGVSPWGGVHQPATLAARCPAAARARQRLSVYAADVVYPRAARPLAILPDELAATFRVIFERDQRGVFPRDVLERLRLRTCSGCGDEHARVRCPTCQVRAHVPPAVVHGRLRWQPIARAEVVLATRELAISGSTLWRPGRLGPERIGDVLAGQTRAWVGATLGIGFYRAGGYTVGFVFRPDRGGLDDGVALPRLRGELVAANAVIGVDRAWLAFTLADQGRLATTVVVVDATAKVVATETLSDATWLTGFAGACAAGPHLFVPTDEGIARIEVVQGSIDPTAAPSGAAARAPAIVATRVFAETASFVGSSDHLALSPGGIDVMRRMDAVRLQLT